MTIPLKMTIEMILTPLFTLGLSLGLTYLTIPVVATHIGPMSVFSDVFSGGGNSSNPINEFDPINKEISVAETIKW
jgi:hypothetical protein